MINASNYTAITTGTTTIIGPAAGTIALPTTGRRINLVGIAVNTTLTGTMVVKSGSTTIASYAIGTVPGMYLQTTFGTEVFDLQITTSAADSITVLWNNL